MGIVEGIVAIVAIVAFLIFSLFVLFGVSIMRWIEARAEKMEAEAEVSRRRN